MHLMKIAERAMAQIEKGAFLTVRAGEALNAMTIGWATMGVCWRKPVLMVAVRNSRHTYSLMEQSADFTVSIPTAGAKDALAFCGTRSGRDVDKFQACGLKTVDARFVASPVLDLEGIHIECRIVYRTPMDPRHLVEDYHALYPEKDYHTLYFGEIQACYEFG